MSSWIHINGMIRLDDLIFEGSEIKEKKNAIAAKIGTMYLFNDLIAYYKKNNREPQTKLPMGSEGTLQYEIIPGEIYNMAFWHIPI